MRKNLAIVGGFAAAALGISLLGGTAARADILPGATTPTVTLTGTGTYLYSYEIFVTNAQDVNTGNFFRFYDFNGLVSVVSAPIGWSAAVTATSPPVVIPGIGTITPNDSAGIPNVTFTYSGPTILGGPTSLGIFQLESTLPPGLVRPFAGSGTDKITGIANGNITNYIAPVPEPGEYAAMGIFGAGLLGLMVRARRKSAKLDDDGLVAA
jgi:hypothetical protein